MRNLQKAAKRWLKGHGNPDDDLLNSPLSDREFAGTSREVLREELLSRTGGGSRMQNKSRLGRGLDALLGGNDGAAEATLAQVSVEAIDQNPYQPRKEFDDDG